MRSVAKVESRRELLVEGKVEEETRYYISSLPGDAKQIGHAVRSHWGVENGLHWVMDMVFRDDECRIRSAHAPANFVKHMASNLLRRGKGKHSMRASTSLVGMRTFAHHLSNPTQSIALGDAITGVALGCGVGYGDHLGSLTDAADASRNLRSDSR